MVQFFLSFYSSEDTEIFPDRQNDAGSRARTTWYWENLFLLVVLETKGPHHKVGQLNIESNK